MIYIPSFGEMLAVAQGRGSKSCAPGLWRDLVGYWPLAAGGGTTAFDLSGYRNHGTLTNMDPATDWVMTEKGPALEFGGDTTDQYVALSSPIDFDVNPFSISLWLDRHAAYAGEGWFSERIGDWGFRLQVNAGDEIVLYYRSGGITTGVSFGNNSAQTGLHHYAFSDDGTNVIAYRDGVAINTGVHPVGHVAGLGAWGYRGNREDSVDGAEQLCAAHSRALLPSEIQQLYADPWAMGRLRQRWFPAAVAAAGFARPKIYGSLASGRTGLVI